MQEQQQQQQQPQRAELAARALMSFMGEVSGTLKLYFTLSTGAVVLFVNLLAASHAPRFVLIPLALSILAFGLAAAFCLRVLLALTEPWSLLIDALASGASESDLKTKLDAWSAQAVKPPAKRMERLFWTGMVFAAIFVVAVIVVR